MNNVGRVNVLNYIYHGSMFSIQVYNQHYERPPEETVPQFAASHAALVSRPLALLLWSFTSATQPFFQVCWALKVERCFIGKTSLKYFHFCRFAFTHLTNTDFQVHIAHGRDSLWKLNMYLLIFFLDILWHLHKLLSQHWHIIILTV